MSRLFQAYIMVDWSAAAKPATGADSIWIGMIKRNVRFQPTYEAHNPATRAEAEALLAGALGDFSKRNERVLVGFDFPLGFPAGTAAALKLEGPPWSALLDFIAAEIRDKPNNANNRFQVAAKMNRLMTGEAFPFWGAPARDAQTTLTVKRPREHRKGDLPEFRLAETAAKGAASVWKLYYQGSVGGQALTGAPMIRRLMKQRPGVRVWPFETGWRPLQTADLEGVEALFAEIYPSMFAIQPAANEIKDAAQVRAAAEHFAALDEKGQLGRSFGPAADDPRRDIVEREEGWILGVAP
jgi:hypothetical protein